MPSDGRPGEADPVDQPRHRRRVVRHAVGFVIGVALLGAAVVSVTRHGDALAMARGRIADSPWWLLAAALVFPAMHLLLAGLTFWFLTKPGADGRARVGVAEMIALVTSGNLANYLPMRPGLVGRVTYHKVVNGISVKESAIVVAQAMVCTVLGVSVLLGGAWAGRVLGLGSLAQVALLGAPALAGGVGAMVLRSGGSASWRFLAAGTARYLDMGAWAARYAIAFEMVGVRLTPLEAAAFTGVAQASMLVPLVGNGVGLREQMLGIVAPNLPRAISRVGGVSARPVALTADLLNRAAEVAVSVPLGLLAGAWLARRLTGHRRGEAAGVFTPVGETPGDDGTGKPSPASITHGERPSA